MSKHIRFDRWSEKHLDTGVHEGTVLDDRALVLVRPVSTRAFRDPHRDGAPQEYDEAVWTSPAVAPGFPVHELVASWNAHTPPGTWLEVALSVSRQDEQSSWYVMGRWAESDEDIAPSSVPGQHDAHGTVDVDRLTLPGDGPADSYRLRVRLYRRAGTTSSPRISLLGCVASGAPASDTEPCEPSAGAVTDRLVDVPCYSQRLHLGQYPQWAGGGESWCSPTSTSMVLQHWGLGPTEDAYSWVEEDIVDRVVPYAARHTFDQAYGGPGNWSFNAAYAGRFGAEAFVTRLRSLGEAEQFIDAGIPLVAAVAFTRDELPVAGYDTDGHLVVIVGFDRRGDVIVNDPGSHEIASNDEVRVTFDRARFERAWLGSSNGISYVIRPPGVALPPAPAEANW